MARPRAEWTPPLRDGVSASRVAVSAGLGPTLLAFLMARMPRVTDWPERLQKGEVLDAQGQPVGADAPARPGALLWYWRQPPPEPRLPFEVNVLHQDEHLVVVDKPHFMAVTPGGRHLHETVLVRLKKQTGLATLTPMHRLDRETAGVMAFVVRPQDRNAYQGLLRDQQVHKVYEAVAPWRADLVLPQLYSSRIVAQEGDGFMQMLTLPGEPNAHTRIELITRLPAGAQQQADDLACDPAPDPAPDLAPDPAPDLVAELAPDLAHYRLTPLTGRKHQLRVHLCALGLPIVGDRIYPRLWPEPALNALPDCRQALQLLARELAFIDPITGAQRRFFSTRTLQSAAAVSAVLAAAPG